MKSSHITTVAVALIAVFGAVFLHSSKASPPVPDNGTYQPVPDSVTYQPIPPGFDFPADETALLKLRDTGDVSGMRKHAWMVFGGLTQPAAGGEAIWEKWFSEDETFALGPTPQGLIPRPPQRRFKIPQQFKSTGPSPQAVGSSLLSFVLFNKETMTHIRSNRFHLRSKLNQINQTFDSAQTPTDKREITAFPRTSVSLKIVWWLVKKTGLTPMPIWDGQPTQPNEQGNDVETWARAVLVDPSRTVIPNDEKRDVFFNGSLKKDSHVVPLRSFYNFQISANEIAAVRRVLGPDAQVGDHAAMVMMHVTTKEIPDWVWATFWWHDRADDGRFAADRPPQVSGVWRNYLMDEAYSSDIPKESDGTPKVCFNPWLEARFSGGLTSNCMACHQRSVWPRQSFLPVTRGSLPNSDQYFAGKTKLDFLWSIAFQSK